MTGTEPPVSMSAEDDLSFEILDSTSIDGPAVGVEEQRPTSMQSSTPTRDIALELIMNRLTDEERLSIPTLTMEFPSLSASQLTDADLVKLQNMIAEYRHLKENLLQANTVIRQYFELVSKWQNDMKRSRDEDKHTLTTLRSENEELQQQLQILRQQLSDRDREIATVSQKSEYRFEAKCQEVDRLQQQLNEMKLQSGEMVPQLTYKTAERQMSQLLAENLQFKDMEQQYLDELNCLKVNRAAGEELFNKTAQDLEQQREANRKMLQELTELREGHEILQQQVQIYQEDFEQEREARQKIAGEKEDLLSEINQLRIRLPVPSASAPPSTSMFTCPSCYALYSAEDLLNTHIQTCGGF